MPNVQPKVEQPAEDDGDWLEEPDELPPRPRRRLLAPVPIALLIVLLTACGFIGGVLVEKGEGSSGPSASRTDASALAPRFAAVRGGSVGSGSSGATGAGAGATAGQVAYIQGSTLYVTTAEGNTVKVTTSKAATVTKTIKATVGSIRPGETVLVTGATGKSGAVSAESIRASASGADGLTALFARSGAGSSTRTGSGGGGGGGGGGGEPALFGKGG
jgi:hypothetical protein